MPAHLKPVEEKIRAGNPGKRPLPEVTLLGGRPRHEFDVPPDWLPEDAKWFWCSTVARLVEVGLLDTVDEPALVMLAVTFSRWREAGRVVARDGIVSTGSHGQLREHPAARLERESARLFFSLAANFGLNPVARSRLGIAELHRRSLAAEVSSALGAPDLRPVDVLDEPA